ncbi:ABC transporter, permease protein [Leptotrichia sp. oral taxon 215 str. W9775]|jgi:ABC transporter, permease protein|uniref:carbohydrate ABC transporter permease n=1 Tax=Leptotrichia sp. oral taxon 215 TaxID=712359 RepID=UPI0003AE12BA|nr:sugar ABC transporter permease [Leptotrichia sp. oral taxon 215]ERK65293.1 ABC transporter, permease protein [Leptotrichia sp. oral taxon 215 str. W9775]MBF1332724.1 sugar ABC transporter permease [Leptotrichia sp.]
MKKNKMKIDKINLVFVLPAMLIVFLLLVYPIISSVYFSFTSKNLIRPYYKWIWFDNFKFVLTNPEFYHAFLTSIKWTVLSITGQLLVGFIAALSLNRIPKFSGFYRTLLIIPWAFPAIVIAFSWKWILNDVYGFIPNLLTQLHITKENINFLADPKTAFWIVLFINIWFGAPLFMVNILAALKTIPREQYEAAIVDGASSFQVFRYITIRHIRGVIGLLVVLRTIWVFNNFDLLYLLTGGGPSDLTTTLPIYAYKTGWNLKRLGTASAVTILLLLFLMAVCFGYFKLLNRWEREDDK